MPARKRRKPPQGERQLRHLGTVFAVQGRAPLFSLAPLTLGGCRGSVEQTKHVLGGSPETIDSQGKVSQVCPLVIFFKLILASFKAQTQEFVCYKQEVWQRRVQPRWLLKQ